MRRLSFLLAGLALLACAADADPGDRESAASPAQLTYATELGVDLDAMTRTESGLYYLDLEEGDGALAGPGSRATVHYTGSLPDGTKFDSSRDLDEPFEFHLGAQQVIAGWDEGVSGMRVNGRRQLVIPPELGYGEAGAGGGIIPPNSTLVFDVELLGVR